MKTHKQRNRNSAHIMRKYTRLLLATLFISVVLNAQKVTLNNDTIYKDGTPYGILIHTGPGMMMNFTLQELSGKEAARIIVSTVPDPNQTNTNNKITYWTFSFFDKDLIAECEVKATNKLMLAELIVSEHLLDGGTLNIDAAKLFIRIYGNPYTTPEQRKN